MNYEFFVSIKYYLNKYNIGLDEMSSEEENNNDDDDV